MPVDPEHILGVLTGSVIAKHILLSPDRIPGRMRLTSSFLPYLTSGGQPIPNPPIKFQTRPPEPVLDSSSVRSISWNRSHFSTGTLLIVFLTMCAGYLTPRRPAK